MPILSESLVRRARICAATILGLVMAATPLALWVAWNQTVFVLVLAMFATALVLFSILSVFEEPRTRDRRNSAPTTRLSDEFLSELSSMGPWIYHNRLPGDPGFQRKMDRLRKR